MMKTEFENTQGEYNMFGDLKTQKWAREALPKLVPLAHERKTITYQEMAETWFDTKGYQNMGKVCGIISTTLYELERRPDWKFGKIPRITNIVIRKNEKPGAWVNEKISGDRNIAPLKDEYYEYHLLPTYEYPYWNEVLEALDFTIPDDIKPVPIDSNVISWKPHQLLTDFLSAAEHGQIEITPDSITIELQPKPHTRPKQLPEGKMAVYVFSTDTEILKVGKVNTGSENRYCRHHYNPQGAGSTLAKSLMEDENIPVMFRPDKKTVSDLIMEHTDRVNFLLDAELGFFVLNLFEAYIQCRLKPKYEGFKSQR
ncbi:hypothetical protein J5I95_08020 [Candidatus Poribacteria bacterium]|nr:hypothetical protein [Candidatus Poribacteria bacterium]